MHPPTPDVPPAGPCLTPPPPCVFKRRAYVLSKSRLKLLSAASPAASTFTMTRSCASKVGLQPPHIRARSQEVQLRPHQGGMSGRALYSASKKPTSERNTLPRRSRVSVGAWGWEAAPDGATGAAHPHSGWAAACWVGWGGGVRGGRWGQQRGQGACGGLKGGDLGSLRLGGGRGASSLPRPVCALEKEVTCTRCHLGRSLS